MPTPATVDKAVEYINKLHANYVYFFDKLDSAEWIEPLAARGFFKHPYRPQSHEGGLVSFPTWPESAFLARVAHIAPDLVTQTLLGIPYTDNVSIHGDFAVAGTSMPGKQAAAISRTERKWMATQKHFLWLLPDRYAKLVVHLAKEREVDEAFRLAKSLLDVEPDPRWEGTSMEDRLLLPKEPLSRMDQWSYQRAAEAIGQALCEVDPERTLSLFADLLGKAMALAEPPQDDSFTDNSYIWRQAIEAHAQNLPDDSPRDVLVTATRDAATAATKSNPLAVGRVVTSLEDRRRTVFRRLALNVLTDSGSDAPQLVTKRLASWENFEDHRIRHEYALLADRHFGTVDPQSRDELLAHLRDPADNDAFVRNYTSVYGVPPTDEQIDTARLGMELRRLSIIKRYLSGEWKRRYEELTKTLGGEPAHPEFTSYSEGVWTGPTSPKSAQELADMSTDELLEFLAEWHPPQGSRFADSYDGLGRELTAAVLLDPNRYAPDAERFAALDPTYVRSFIDALDQAVSQDKPFEWPSVLRLCAIVVGHGVTETEERETVEWEDRDPGWRWARGSIAHLLGAGMGRTGGGTIPIAFRELVWKTLAPLTDDPEPSPSYESKYGGSNMDPLTLSINTNRGKAMHSAIAYGMWVRRDDDANHQERSGQGFAVVPELRDVLDTHLDTQKDPSLAIHSVYGERLPWLVLMDRDWVKANLAKIFPSDQALVAFRDAAWDSYLSNNAFENVVDLLHAEYHRAVSELANLKEDQGKRRFLDPAQRLAEHLMWLYWGGKLSLGVERGLLSAFFEVAPAQIRAHAIDYVGHGLWRGDYELPADQADRLMTLWDRRWQIIARAPESNDAEAAAFGWWAASTKLPASWVLDRLTGVLEAKLPITSSHLVLERLADLVAESPVRVTRAARLLISVDPERHFLAVSDESVRRIASHALDSENAEAIREGKALVNELGALGYRAFDDLGAKL